MKQLSMEEQRELVNDWFNGKYFIEVKPNDYKLFIDFIALYDKRYNVSECYSIEKTQYMAWRFCEGLHHHQLEYANDKNYWKGEMLPLDKVRQYISIMAKSIIGIKKLDKSLKGFGQIIPKDKQ